MVVVALVEMKEMEVVKARVWLLVKRSEKKRVEMKRKSIYRVLDL